MRTADGRLVPSRLVVIWRVTWTILSLIIVEIAVCGLSAAPAVLIWSWLLQPTGSSPLVRVAVISLALVPSYLLFALCLMIVSPVATRALGWCTPPDAEMRITDMDWALMGWVRYGASLHLVRLVAGSLLRGTPLWTMHLRLGGARLGRRVYVNSLSVSDYNLIACGDDVVIGAAVHLSGHTVEAGVVKTARVTLGNNVTIGLGSVIEIGVAIGSNCQIGALSFVPKHTTLAGGVVYAGVPAVPLATGHAVTHRH